MRNITPIVENHTCAQCGTCIAVCPRNAIGLYQHRWRGLLPVVDEKRCNQCRLCLRVCPGEEIDFNGLQRQVFGHVPDDIFFGHFRRVLSGYSTDGTVRYNGTSGGVVTGMLIYLLEKNEIDGALVVNMQGKEPLWPHVFIARSREEVISAQQSKYLPVPMNIGLKEILEDRNGRYAVLGLPCHFQGLRKYEKIEPRLKEQIVLRIGLLCGFNPTLSSTKFLLKRADVKDYKDVVDIKYRDGDWPCGFRAVTKDGADHFLYPIQHFLFSHYVFHRYRCAMCMDHTNELSDLSVGDEWRAEWRGDAAGWSHVIVRTDIAETFLYRMAKEGVLVLEDSSRQSIYGGQCATMIYKKRGTPIFGKIQQAFGRRIPRYLKTQKIYPKFEYFVGACLISVVPRLFENWFIKMIFLRVSQRVLNRYRLTVIRLFRK